jgi:hypothetical protein
MEMTLLLKHSVIDHEQSPVDAIFYPRSKVRAMFWRFVSKHSPSVMIAKVPTKNGVTGVNNWKLLLGHSALATAVIFRRVTPRTMIRFFPKPAAARLLQLLHW